MADGEIVSYRERKLSTGVLVDLMSVVLLLLWTWKGFYNFMLAFSLDRCMLKEQVGWLGYKTAIHTIIVKEVTVLRLLLTPEWLNVFDMVGDGNWEFIYYGKKN